MFLAIHEAIWLRRFFHHLEIVKTTFKPVIIYGDSMVVLAYSKDPQYHEKTKHIPIRYHFIRDMIT